MSGQAEPTARLNPQQGSSRLPVWSPGHLQMLQIPPQPSLAMPKAQTQLLVLFSCYLLDQLQLLPPLNEALT